MCNEMFSGNSLELLNAIKASIIQKQIRHETINNVSDIHILFKDKHTHTHNVIAGTRCFVCVLGNDVSHLEVEGSFHGFAVPRCVRALIALKGRDGCG